MTTDSLFPPKTVETLRGAVLHPVTYSDDMPSRTAHGPLFLHRNLSQFVGRSAFQSCPNLLSEMFTSESMYKVPVATKFRVSWVLAQADGKK